MKRYIVCFLMFMCICLITEKAYALSVQARGMVGAIPFAGGDPVESLSANVVGLDVFVYEGGNLDIFLGIEQDSKDTVEKWSSGDAKLTYSAKGNAFDIGFRFKPTTSWRIKPYFPVELLYFQDISYNNLKLESTETGQTYTILSYSQPDSKIGARLGVGTDIGLSDRLTLGFQLYFNALPGLKYKYRRTEVQTGAANEYENSSPASGFIGINLGLRYSF